MIIWKTAIIRQSTQSGGIEWGFVDGEITVLRLANKHIVKVIFSKMLEKALLPNTMKLFSSLISMHGKKNNSSTCSHQTLNTLHND